MSTPFKYELDESRIKSQLRQVAIPLNPEAWQWFELQADLDVQPVRVNRLAQLSLPHVNKKAVLPAVFGIMVILATTLILKLTSIGDPRVASSDVEKTVTASAKPAASSERAMEVPTGSESLLPAHDEVAVRAPAIHVSSAITSPAETGEPASVAPKQSVPKPAIRRKRAGSQEETLATEPLPAIQPPLLVPAENEPELKP